MNTSRNNVSAWRAWAEAAPPELRELFDERTLECLQVVRRRWPADCTPGTGDYANLRRESTEALDALACHIQEGHDDAQY